MYARVLLCAAALAAPPLSGVYAQEQTEAPGAPQAAAPQPQNGAAAGGDLLAVQRAIETLSANVSRRLDQMERNLVTRQELENYVPRAEFEELQGRMNELQQSFNDQAAQIRRLREDMGEQVTTLTDQAQQIRSIVDAISRTDSQNRPILDLNASMQSQEFQRDLTGAVHNSLQRQGVLRVSNQMSTTQFLRVNGQLHSIPPNVSNYEIAVPVGTLTTELLGEAPKNWTISPPNYEQGIIIAPRQSSVVVASPVVYWTF